MLLNDVHLPLLIQSVLSEHKTLVWKNLDQLSFLWAVFTKCKNDIKDGFRLENLSWRLWYRHSILQKKKIAKQVEFKPQPTTPKVKLSKSHSLPNLCQYKENIHSQHIYIPSSTTNRNKPKFYLNEEEQQQQQQLTFPKKICAALTTPSVSLLSDMILQRTTTETTGLRRCKSRYCPLDQFFINAA